MKKLIWLVDMSLDGFMSGVNGELDWLAADIDDEMWADVNDLLSGVDATLFGRVTYQNFENYWPTVPNKPASPKNELDFSHWIEATPKTVVSKTLRKLPWKNSTLLNGDVATEIARMKSGYGKSVLMFGSCNLASCLLEMRLIDELHMRIHPVILGAGRPLFRERSEHKLTLMKSRLFGSGVAEVRYEVS